MAEALLALLTQQRPNLQTRKGLIISSLQNDFISSDGKLPVSIPPGYFERIQNLVSAFREFGDVIWVRSEFESNREVNSNDEGGDTVMIEVLQSKYAAESEEDDERDSPVPPKRQRVSPDRIDHLANTEEEIISNGIRRKSVDEELFLMQTATKEPCCLPDSPGGEFAPQVESLIDTNKDLVFTSTHYSAFGSPSLLVTLRSKLITDLFLCGGPTNLSVYATATDAARYGLQITLIDDCLVARNQERHNLAIQYLCETLEAELITSDELVRLSSDTMSSADEHELAETNENEYGHAQDDSNDRINGIRGAQYDEQHIPVGQPLEEDDSVLDASLSRPASSHVCSQIKALRFESPAWRNAAARKLRSVPTNESLGSAALANDLSNIDVIEVDDQMSEPDSQVLHGRLEKPNEFESADASGVHRLAGDESLLDTTAFVQSWMEETGKATASSKHPGLNAIASLVPGLDQNTVGAIEADTFEQLRSRLHSSPRDVGNRTMQPLFGDGKEIESANSGIIYDLLPSALAETIFEKLDNEVTWQRMYHQTGEVPRLVCCQGSIGPNGSMPVYRYPSDQTLPTQPWTPLVDQVRKAAEEVVGHRLNHALIQLYRGGADYISEHSDKTLDIVKDSYIVNVSFGAQRTMRLRTKRRAAVDADGMSPARTTYRIPMPHNSMIKMSLATNAEYLHGINADKRPAVEISEVERAFDGHRISLTFRNIGTFLNEDSTRIWGQGAKSKLEEFASPVVNADAAERARVIRAFGAENQATSIQWDSIYGGGFDALHLK